MLGLGHPRFLSPRGRMAPFYTESMQQTSRSSRGAIVSLATAAQGYILCRLLTIGSRGYTC